MTAPACHLPATDASQWDTARVSRLDWPGAGRMARGRVAAGAELDDTDREALRRDEGARRGASTDTLTNSSTLADATSRRDRGVQRTAS